MWHWTTFKHDSKVSKNTTNELSKVVKHKSHGNNVLNILLQYLKSFLVSHVSYGINQLIPVCEIYYLYYVSILTTFSYFASFPHFVITKTCFTIISKWVTNFWQAFMMCVELFPIVNILYRRSTHLLFLCLKSNICYILHSHIHLFSQFWKNWKVFSFWKTWIIVE